MIDFWEGLKATLQQNQKYKTSIQNGYHPIKNGLYKQYNRFRPNGPKPVFCYVPFNSLTFSFSGKVFSCSYNRDVQLGTYPNQSIDEIWNSEQAKKLRAHMLNNDLSYGCHHCHYFVEKSKFSNLKPLVFDKYYENTDAEYPQVMEFEMSNECNLECQMCIGEVSSSIRKNRDKLPPIPMPYDDAFLAQLAKYIPHLKEAKFYGGEPFLISIYYKIWDLIKELNPTLPLFVITNGSHWNSKIETLINELDFDVAVSIDAVDKNIVEGIRKNIQHDKLMTNIKRFSEVCRKKGKYLSLSFTVQQDNWKELPRVIELCNEVDAFIFISYLERPIQFSITEFSTEQLQEILNYMKKISLPKFSQKERHNARCFEDFKNFIQAYINNPDEKRYHQYRADSEIVKEKKPELYRSGDFIFLQNKGNRSELEQMIAAAVDTNPALQNIDKSTVLNKLNEALSIYSNEEKDLIYGMIKLAPIEQSITMIANSSIEELQMHSNRSLPKVVVA